MNTLFFDDFKTFTDKQYPYNWTVENNCENPSRLGWVDNAEWNFPLP